MNELDFIQDEIYWKQSTPEFSFRYLCETYPMTKSLHKQKLKREIEEWSRDLEEADRLEKEMSDLIYRKASKETEDFWRAVMVVVYVEPLRKDKEKMIERNKWNLWVLEGKMESKGITEEMIERAREYRVDKLVEFKNKVAKCLWHNDRHPSLTYFPKTNTCKCFSCGEFADSIKVFRQINNCSFKEAVNKLQ